MKFYWVLFPIEDFKTSGGDRKENTDKRKDRQLAGEYSSTQFMNKKDSYIKHKKGTFDTQNGLEEKIDRLTMMMSRLTTKEDQNKWFKPKMYQSKRRGQIRNIYDRCNYQNGYRSESRPRYEQNFRRYNFIGNVRMYESHNQIQNYTRQ